MKLICGRCKEEKEESKFSRNSASRTGYQSICKDCHNKYVRTEWYPKNREKQIKSVNKYKKANLAKTISYNYDSTELEVQKVLDKQSCEICGGDNRLVVDHDHKTNKVRGRLCHGCNVAIGFFNEDVDRLQAAVVYLQRNRPLSLT